MKDEYFESTKTYSLLMASTVLYEQLESYDYVLMYQLDCLVFKDDLRYWCSRGYDLCSSACFKGAMGWVTHDFVSIGGLSLRKVDSCLRVLRLATDTPMRLKNHQEELLAYGQEDVWWSWCAPVIDPTFSLVPLNESIDFSFNGNPRPYLVRANKLPPFACHGWLSIGALLCYYKYIPLREPARMLRLAPIVLFLVCKSTLFRLQGLMAALLGRVGSGT